MEERRKDARREPVIVDLEALVPEDHLLRKIERVMDYEWLYALLSPYYCHDNGRPGIDPVVLIKMVLIQHLFGIASLRQTYREIQVNVAYRWFLGYGLLEQIPHFATVSYAFCKRFPDEVISEILNIFSTRRSITGWSIRAWSSSTVRTSRPVPIRRSSRRSRSERQRRSTPVSFAGRSMQSAKSWGRSRSRTMTTTIRRIPAAEKRQKRRSPQQIRTAECS